MYKDAASSLVGLLFIWCAGTAAPQRGGCTCRLANLRVVWHRNDWRGREVTGRGKEL